MSAPLDSTASPVAMRLQRGSLLAARIVAVLGALVLVGWGFDIAALKSAVPGLVTMKVNTALCFILSGVALALLREERSNSRRQLLTYVLVWVVIVLALMTLTEYYLGRNLGIDQLLIGEPQIGGFPAAPGRMAPTTALGFALTGIALLLLARNSARAIAVSQGIAILAGFNALLAIAGYLYRARALIDVSIRGVRSNMAVNTAVLFGFLTFGILAARPDAGFMATIASRHAGGVTARRMLPFAILVPLTLGWLRLQGQVAGFYGTNFGLAIFATSNVVVFTIVIFLGARSLNRTAGERELAESALRESEERYRALFDYAPNGIVIADAESFYLDANASICRMLGYSHDELVGLHASDIVVPTEVEHVGPALEAIKAKSEYHREWQFRRKDGSVFEAEVIASLMPDGNLMGMIRDITERKRAEEALRASEARLHAADRRLAEMVQGMTEACFALDAEWRFTFLNDRGETLFHHSRGDLLGRPIWEVFHQLVGTPMEAHYRTAMAERVPVTFEAFSPIAGRWLDIRVFPTGEGIAAFLLDIDARKRAEEALRHLNENLEQRVIERTAQLEVANTELRHSRAELESLFESLPGLYLVLTPDLTIVAVSDAYLKATLTTREGLVGRHLFDMFPDNPDDPETTAVANMQASINRVIQNAAPDTMAIQKHDIRGPGGVFEEHYWSPVNSPVFGADRQIQYIVHRVEEVTDFVRQKARPVGSTEQLSARVQQMEAEVFQSSQRLQATNQQLEAANRGLELAGRHKSDFLAGMSHELRTPLNGIIGFAEFLIDEKPGPLRPKQKEYLGDVLNSANHLLKLINDVLDLAKVESGKMDLFPEIFSVHNAIGEVTAVIEGIARKKQVSVTSMTGDRLDAVLLDLQKFKQVLYNLLSNAVKFTPEGGKVTIQAGRLDPDQIEVRVQDTGIGIKAEDLSRLFVEFAQLDSGTTRRFEGSGLGLALTKKIVEFQGGHIRVESEPGKGSTFTVVLPLGNAGTLASA